MSQKNKNSFQEEFSEEAIVDFTRSVPPQIQMLSEALRDFMLESSEQTDLNSLVRVTTPGGTGGDRYIAAQWLAKRFGNNLDANRVRVGNGTQNLLLMLLKRLLGDSGVLACENLTYVMLKPLADYVGVAVVGVEIDDDGVVPESLLEVCQTHNVKALYCNPTVHNPTTSIMSAKRRAVIAETARQCQLTIIEDDVLGILHPQAPPPIATFAPECTWYIMSMTKCMAQGIRIAYFVGPDTKKITQLLSPFMRMSTWGATPFHTAAVNHWIETGAAAAITAEIQNEMAERHKIMNNYLSAYDVTTKNNALHAWFKLPDSIQQSLFVDSCKSAGVLMRPAQLFEVEPATKSINAVRLSLSSPETREQVATGFRKIASILEQLEDGKAT